jgi:hypothetical protein
MLCVGGAGRFLDARGCGGEMRLIAAAFAGEALFLGTARGLFGAAGFFCDPRFLGMPEFLGAALLGDAAPLFSEARDFAVPPALVGQPLFPGEPRAFGQTKHFFLGETKGFDKLVVVDEAGAGLCFGRYFCRGACQLLDQWQNELLQLERAGLIVDACWRRSPADDRHGSIGHRLGERHRRMHSGLRVNNRR